MKRDIKNIKYRKEADKGTKERQNIEKEAEKEMKE